MIYADLSDLLAYHEKLELAALKMGGSGAAARDWIQDRDETTRTAAVVLTRKGYPLGEALIEAYRDEKVNWKPPLTPAKRGAVAVDED